MRLNKLRGGGGAALMRGVVRGFWVYFKNFREWVKPNHLDLFLLWFGWRYDM